MVPTLGWCAVQSGWVSPPAYGAPKADSVPTGRGTFFFTSPEHMGWGLPWGPIMGIVIGMVAGAIFASIHALATVTFKVDQIVSGVAINMLAAGLTVILGNAWFGQPELFNRYNPLAGHLPGHGGATTSGAGDVTGTRIATPRPNREAWRNGQ